jgi:alpha-2-macroglobulin
VKISYRATWRAAARHSLATYRSLGCALCFACSANNGAPAPVPVGVLEAVPRGGASEIEPLTVVYAGPEGAATRTSSINLLFNKPMHALEAAAASAPPALDITPALAGSWQWRGARALSFVPALGHLPGATAFRVSVPAGTRALDGDTLAAPYEFRFETPEPAVVHTEPEPAASGQEPDVQIDLRFNQPVAAAEVLHKGRLRAWRGQRAEALEFSARVSPNAPEQVEIHARHPLPLGASIEFELASGLLGSEGPRPMSASHMLRFETYGPLRVVSMGCNVIEQVGGCDPEGSLWVELSNPVKSSEFRKHLQVEPALSLLWSEDVAEENRYFYLPSGTSLSAATNYRISLSPGLLDTHGQRLARAEERLLTTGNFSPRVRLPISGEVFAAPLASLELQARNAPGLRVFSQRLDAEKLLDYFALQESHASARELPQRLGASASSVQSPLDNLWHPHAFALGPVLGAGTPRGAAWLGWQFDGSPPEGQLVQVTDLALTAKLSEQGSLVWVTRLSDGRPVPGAHVELLGRSPPLARHYQSDADGLVLIPAAEYRPRLQDYGSGDDTLLFVRHEGDVSFRRVADFLPPWRIEPALRLSGAEREAALLFSERGIYRPGDTLRIKGIVRREATTGSALLVGRKLVVQLQDAFGEVADKYNVETTRFGTFALDMQLPGSAALGRWRILAEGFDEDALGIEVAEYRAAEFKVKVEAAQPSRVQGESAQYTVRADYLFGSPMSGATLGYGATRQRTSFTPAGATGYVTSDDAYREDLELAPLNAAVFARAETRLSAQGVFELALPLVLPGQTGPEQVRLDADVSDVSRQVLSASAAVLVHPASYYLGIAELDSWFQSSPALLKPRILALTPDGRHVAGRPVTLELVRRRWTVAREKTAEGWRTVSTPLDETQATCELSSAAQPVSCELPLKESGQHFIVATSRDEHGRGARSSLGFYALGAGRPSWADNDRRTLALVLDKKQYRVGDTARLLIKSPFARAEALVTVERAGLYQHRRVTLEGPTPSLEIPIDESLRPNAFVSVHLIQGVAANAPPQPAEVTPESGYRLGYAELIVDPEARRLQVELAGLSPEYRPGQRVHVDVQVKARGGEPHAAELTVYAVDEGVLSLIGYQLPDPLLRFTRSRPLGVATLESRDALGRLLLPGPERDKGMAGGDGGGFGARSDFRTTAYFNPNLVTDARGRAQLEFTLPDNLTTFRLMAVAVSEDDRYGAASALLTVNQPLMIRPALPRSLRAGDRFEASAIVTSRNYDPGALTVSAKITGAKLLGPAEQQLRLAKNASSEVRFPVEVMQAGVAEFEFEVSSGGERDKVAVKRNVSSPVALEASAVYGRTDQSEAQQLGDVAKLRDDVGGLEVGLASTALVGLDAPLNELIEYPYACTEQLATRLLPLAPLAALAERYGLPAPKNLAAQLEAGVGEILRRQRGDGGFGLWPDSPETHAWTSGYALWVSWQAKQAGARLPERVFQQGVAYMRGWLGQPRSTPLAWATAALFVDVLAELGQPDRQYVSELFEHRAELPAFARAFLLHAAASSASEPKLVSVLAQELANLVTLRGDKAQIEEPHGAAFADVFDSPARTEALALWALLRVDPQHPLGPALAQGILGRRSAGRWRSTQESAYALLALDAYRRAREPEAPHFEASVWLGTRQLLQAAFEGPDAHAVSQRFAMPELQRNAGLLRFDKQGQGTLFYQARLRYAPRSLPEAALERGFSVNKGMRSVRVEALAAALARVPEDMNPSPSLSAGDLVLIDLVVAAPGLRHFVVIEDPLPAGLEAVDARLATTSAALDVDAAEAGAPGAEEAPGSGFQSAWYRRELRDDRVSFFVDEMPAGLYHYRYLARATALGRFVVPPTRAEEMYQPEVFGRTAASSVEVR